MKVVGFKTWKELTTGVRQLIRLLFLTIILSTPDLSCKPSSRQCVLCTAPFEEILDLMVGQIAI